MKPLHWRTWLQTTPGTAARAAHRSRRRKIFRPELETLEQRWLPSIKLNVQPIRVVEGQSTTMTVATFTDSTPSPAAKYTAVIHWGDSQSSTGTITLSADNTTYVVTGSHVYADEGSPTISVSIKETGDDHDTASNTAVASVAEADSLTASSLTFNATEGQSFTGTLATFTDAYSVNAAADFAATISWGDGSNSTGTVSDGNGVLSVTGTHTYTDEASFTVTVTLTDKNPGTATASALSTAAVAEGDNLTGSSLTISAAEATQFHSTVATFTDTNSTAASSDFTALINWGDGSTTTGSVVGHNGTFDVVGAHVWTDEGNYTITVTLTDGTPTTATASISSSSAVADSDKLVAHGATAQAIEGSTISGTVATFKDSNSTAPASDFTAVIDWGDGSTATGTLSGTGTFSVTGAHTYTDDGSFTITVTLTEDAPGSASAASTATATILDPGQLRMAAPAFSPIENQTFSGTVTVFADSFVGNSASDFTALINWGDGSSSTGTVVGSGGLFAVLGTHTYAQEAPRTVVVSVSDPGAATVTASAIIATADAPLTITRLSPPTPSEYLPSGGVLATFTDANPAAVVGDFTGTVAWGDGALTTVSGAAGSIVRNSDGSFSVIATHTYTADGGMTFSLTLHDVGGAATSQVRTITVAETPLKTVGQQTPSTEQTLQNQLSYAVFALPAVQGSPGLAQQQLMFWLAMSSAQSQAEANLLVQDEFGLMTAYVEALFFPTAQVKSQIDELSEGILSNPLYATANGYNTGLWAGVSALGSLFP
jgi:hypothetical protein